MREIVKLLTRYIQGNPRDMRLIGIWQRLDEFLSYCQIDESQIKAFLEK